MKVPQHRQLPGCLHDPTDPASNGKPALQATRASPLRIAIDALPQQLAVIDGCGRVVLANHAWTRGPEPHAEPLPGIGGSYLHLWEGELSREAQEVALGVASVVRGTSRRFTSRFRCRHPNRWCELSMTRIDVPPSVHVLVMYRDVTESEQAGRALRLVSRRLARAQELERRRIARELHDESAQNLAALCMTLARAEQASRGPDPSLPALLREARDLGERSVAELRTLSYVLNPPMLDRGGLVAAVRWYVCGFAKRSGIEIELRACADFGRMPREVELALFTVVRECLANVYRHSGGGKARVEMRRERGRAVVEVANEGAELSNEQRAGLHHSIGLGIRGTRERLQAVGGTFTIRAQRRGVIAIATVPSGRRRGRHAHLDRG
jgi:two-component system, NarL family, sensor kinase